MKKFKNIFLAFAAISALSLAFVSCSDDSDDDSSSSNTATDTPTDPTQDPTNTVTTTTDSWDLTGEAIIGKTLEGWMWAKNSSAPKNVYVAATTADSKILDAKDASSTVDISGRSSNYSEIYNVLKSNMDIDGASGNLKLSIANYAGTGVGTTKVGTEAAEPTVKTGTDTTEPKALGFKAKSDAGLLIKKDALKIAGVKGKVKLTISWYMASAKSARERNLEVTVGSDGTPEETGCTASKGDQPDYTVSFDGGEDGKDVFIGASNEILIKSIKIEAQ